MPVFDDELDYYGELTFDGVYDDRNSHNYFPDIVEFDMYENDNEPMFFGFAETGRSVYGPSMFNYSPLNTDFIVCEDIYCGHVVCMSFRKRNVMYPVLGDPLIFRDILGNKYWKNIDLTFSPLITNTFPRIISPFSIYFDIEPDIKFLKSASEEEVGASEVLNKLIILNAELSGQISQLKTILLVGPDAAKIVI